MVEIPKVTVFFNLLYMIYIDIIIGIVLIFGIVQGCRHGIVKEIAFFVAIALGIIVAKMLAPEVAQQLQSYTSWKFDICLIVSYASLFLIVSLVLHIVAYLLTKALKFIALGWLNRLLGGLFGLLKWGLIASVVLNLMITIDLDKKFDGESFLFEPVAAILTEVLGFAEEVGLPTSVEEVINM